MSARDIRLALDIGTRKVVGLAFAPTPAGAEIVAAVRREHAGRAMRDGQIHDVPAVAGVLREVAAALRAETGAPLPAACVAAAGRSLLTARGSAGQEGPDAREISPFAVRELEWEAVAAAQAALPEAAAAGDAAGGYYCVGHTLVRSWLDDAPITHLAGQWGRNPAVEVLATFLPRGVVDALQAALLQAGLDMAGLTLEPIAALEAVVTPTMRHLNLALVDIGAGTSDIAVTRDGTVHAYAMVARAGDAVTEAVARALLLDFGVAEAAKRRCAAGQPVRVENVLGQRRDVTPELLREAVAPAVAELARTVSDAVLAVNGGPPGAVLLVGGGSLTPGLPEALAAALGLPADRVAVRGRRAVAGVTGARAGWGPDMATPIGIAMLAARTGHLPLVRVQVGQRWVRLFQPGRCTLGEALRAAGVPRAALLGRPGHGITVTVNGRVRAFPGSRPVPGRVCLDGQPANLETLCPDRSRVTWEPGRDGEPSAPRVGDAVPDEGWLPVVLGGEEVSLSPLVLVDGRPAALDEPLSDRAVVQARPCATAGDLAALVERYGAEQEGSAAVAVNGQPVMVRCPVRLLVNGVPVDPDAELRPGSRVEWTTVRPTIAAAAAAAGLRLPDPVPVQLNGRRVRLRPPVRWRHNGAQAAPETELADGDAVEVQFPQGWQPMLHEVLPDAGLGPGRSDALLVMRVNGQSAGFTTPLPPGAAVEVRWEPRPGKEGYG